MNYAKDCGRLKVSFTKEYGDMRCVSVSCLDGWNDIKPPVMLSPMSVEEARDLRYLLDRAIVAAES